jgi:uncharacterized protein (TIGR02217 family)
MADFESFHDVLFPVAISFGATGGPERLNEIVTMTSGRERRNARFAHSRRRYDAGTGIRSLDDLAQVAAFFEARRGSLHAFRFRDPFEAKSCGPGGTPEPGDQPIATGDGASARFALVKVYGEGVDAYRRVISKPVAGSVRLAVDGVEQDAGTDFSVDAATGEIVFAAAPGNGAAITAGFVFDVPVRFDIAHLSLSLTAFKAGQIPSIPLVEVRP